MERPDSAPPPEANPRVPRPGGRRGPTGPVAFVRDSVLMGWRWLTRMRTALYLLGALGLLTMLATVVPQQPNVPSTVAEWRAGESGPGQPVVWLIDLVGGFDVYGSTLFNAFLLLLYLSLTACLIPRIRAWFRLVRRSQPPLVRHLGRGDRVARFATDRSPDEVHAAAADLLSSRWRVRRSDPPSDGDEGEAGEAARPASSGPPPQVAAERGLWSREGGSLLFHLSFYVLLLAIILGQLLTFEGQRGVVEGEAGFTDAPISYWTYRPGRWFQDADHAGWRLTVDRFHVDWVRDPTSPVAGQPTTFRSEVTVTPGDGGEPYQATVEGNDPLVVEGMKIHQLDWGYALRVVVEVDGQVVHDGFVHSQTGEGDLGVYRSAVKAPAAEPDVGLALSMLPFAPPTDDGGIAITGAPWPDAPVLVFDVYRGDLQLGATQQTINQLDVSQLEQVGTSALRPGQETEVEGVTVRFPELRYWVGFQVSTRPQIPWLLLGSGLLIAGLIPALYAYRRRLWVLTSRDGGEPRTIVTVAGRAFQRPDAFEEEHDRIVRELAHRLGGLHLDAPVDGDPTGDDRAAGPAPSPGPASDDDGSARRSAVPDGPADRVSPDDVDPQEADQPAGGTRATSH